MNPLLFAVIAMHAGQLYEVDSGLTFEDCSRLIEPGYITEFEISPGYKVMPDNSTRFDCVQWEAPRPANVPGYGPAADKISGRHGVTVLQYGDDRTCPGCYAEIMRGTGLAMKAARKARKHGGRTTRGRPRNHD